MLTLHLLGGASLDRSDGPVTGRAVQRRRLALLAVLALARGRPVSRDRLMALFWPEADADGARHLLRDSLYVLRSALGDDVVLSVGDDLRLNEARISSDVACFEAALDAGALADGVARYRAPFLDGIHVSGSEEFERWAEDERTRLAGRHAAALERLATCAAADGDLEAAAGWWRRLATIDPLNGRVALALARTLCESGDPAGALQHLRAHTTLLADELDAPPDPAIAALVERLRSAPVVPARRVAAPPTTVVAAPLTAGDLVSVPAASSGAVGDDPAVAEPATPHRRAALPARTWRWQPIAGLIAVALLALSGLSLRRVREERVALDRQAIAVFPFHVDVADSSLRYLREGMLGLLDAKLIGVTHTVSARATLRTLRTLGGDADLAPKEARVLARRLGAARAIVGDVAAGARGQITISATLLDATSRAAPRTASVAGPADSVPALVDELAAQLLVLGADQREDRIATLAAIPLPALRAFLDGQAAIRQGQFERACDRYIEALRTDSTFVLAGLELVYASGGCVASHPNAGQLGRRVLWAGHDRLSPRDRVVADAYLGPRFPQAPTAAEVLTSAERAVGQAVDNPAAWSLLANAYFHFGPVLGIPDAHDRARRAFARGLAIDSGFLPFAPFAVAVHAAYGDTAGARRIAARGIPLEPTSSPGYSSLWIVGTTLGDSALLRRWRLYEARSLPDLGNVVDWAIEVGGSLTDAERALALRRAGAASDQERFEAWRDEHLLALARGQPARLTRAYQALLPVPSELPARRTVARWTSSTAAQWAMLDALFDCGDPALAARARSAVRGVRSDSLATPAEMAVAALYDLAHGDVRTAEHVDSLLHRLQSSPVDPDGRLQVARLALLLDAPLAAAVRRADAYDALVRLDSALRDPPPPNLGSDDLFVAVGNLVAARLWEQSGNRPRALAAVRRRVFFLRRAYLLGASLREEGRLAALVGEREGAIRAYRRYLRLRSEAEPVLRGEVEAVRRELVRLNGAGMRH